MRTPIATNSLVLGGILTRHARYRGEELAVVFGANRLSYSAFNGYVNRWANALQSLGVQRGDRVATVLPNTLELLATYWSCSRLGAAAVPLSPLLLEDGLVSLFSDAQPRVVVTSEALRLLVEQAMRRLANAPAPRCVLIDGTAQGFESETALMAAAPEAEPAVAVEADDLATIMYTSGTTGLPKGIMHTHFIRSMYAGLLASNWEMRASSKVLHTGAIIFNGALVTMLPAFYAGATYILHEQFNVDAMLETIAAEQVTHMMLVPSQIVSLLHAPGFDPTKLQSLEMILSLGAPLQKAHKDALNAALPGRFCELYGLTEGFITILDRTDAMRKAGSVGIPPPFYEMRIVDEDGRNCAPGTVGEILGRGPITMPGYVNQADLTDDTLRGGWVHSGDLGYVDGDGYLYLVDRKKDMIDSGGVKVYPKDIEEIGAQHPAVREIAVFGIPHDKWGETPLAAVVLRPGPTVEADELRDWINTRVSARYQCVHRVVIMSDFPRNAAGKILKREMRHPYWEGRDQMKRPGFVGGSNS
jgi:long-chain acyl-CoA synthetase